MTSRRAQAGFTLVELLVTLALLSLLIGYALSALFVWQKMDAATARNEAQENVSIVARFLRTSFEDMLPGLTTDTAGRRQLFFQGSQDRIQFLALSPGVTETGGIYEVTVWRDDEGRLLLARKLHGGGQAEAEPPHILLSGVRSLAFSYSFCPAPEGGGPGEEGFAAGDSPERRI